MFCPDCGFEADDARFCPECGQNLDEVRASLGGRDEAPPARPAPRAAQPAGRTTGNYKTSRSAAGRPARDDDFDDDEAVDVYGEVDDDDVYDEVDEDEEDYEEPPAPKRPAARPARPARPARRSAAAATRPASRRAASARPARPQNQARRRSSTWIWLAVLGVSVVVIVAVFAVSQLSSPSASGASGGGPSQSAPVTADTSGSYSELVARANGLYDQGAQALQKKDTTGVTNYFGAAATVYGAAWKKQPGDPAVGTDYATSIYYSGDTTGAIQQVDKVLAKSPNFQNARMNKGIFLQAAQQTAQQNGQSAKAAQDLAQAKAEFQKAIQIDPASAGGQKAAQILKTL